MQAKPAPNTSALTADVQSTWRRFGWVAPSKKTAGDYPCPACVGLRRHTEPHTCKINGQYVER
jgi:hypothetical protein